MTNSAGVLTIDVMDDLLEAPTPETLAAEHYKAGHDSARKEILETFAAEAQAQARNGCKRNARIIRKLLASLSL